jgi:tetratricopeptide (TPR) repeat protein
MALTQTESAPTASEPIGFDRRAALAAAAIFVVAVTLRLVYLAEIDQHPLLIHPINDAKAYDDWAARIAAGDWWGTETFYQAPAYPYLLALIYKVGGHDLALAHTVQMVMGGISCVLLFGATRILFGGVAALAAGLMLAVYGPAIGFDGILGKQGLGLLLTTGSLFALVSFQRRPRRRTAVAIGMLLGLLALTRENALVFAVAVPMWMLWRHSDRGFRSNVASLSCFALGLILTLGLVASRNYLVGNTFALTTSQLGPNFYIGNNANASGLYEPLVPGHHTPVFESPDGTRLAEQALGRKLTSGEVSNYWLGLGLEFVREEPLQWTGLMVYKFLLTWNEFEIADTEDLYIYAEDSRLLGWLLPLFHFGVVVPLAAAGFVMAWDRRRDLWLLPWLAAVFSASVALFMVFARMRYPLVPILLPLAGFALVAAIRSIRQLDADALGGPLVAFAVAGILANLPLLAEDQFRSTGYTNIAGVLLQQREWDQAEAYLEKARTLDAENANLDFNFAVLRLNQGQLIEAEDHVRSMMEVSPGDPRGHQLLAIILTDLGREDEARAHRAEARRLDPSRSLRQGIAAEREARP